MTEVNINDISTQPKRDDTGVYGVLKYFILFFVCLGGCVCDIHGVARGRLDTLPVYFSLFPLRFAFKRYFFDDLASPDVRATKRQADSM